jgi:hypothetical protein
MEVESTKVSTLPNGKKVIDVTMRRTNGSPAQSQITPPVSLIHHVILTHNSYLYYSS